MRHAPPEAATSQSALGASDRSPPTELSPCCSSRPGSIGGADRNDLDVALRPSAGLAASYRRHLRDCQQVHRQGGTLDLSLVEADHRPGTIEFPPLHEMAITVVVAGGGDVEVDYGHGVQRYHATPGTIDLRPAETACALMLPRVQLRTLGLPLGALEGQLDAYDLRLSDLDPLIGMGRSITEAVRVLDTMWKASERPAAESHLFLDTALFHLVAILLASAGEARLLAPAPSVDDRRLQRAIDYAESHIDRAITVAELADVACISIYHFARVFRQTIGETPHRYIMVRRVERAKDLLRSTPMELSAVAAACGFASQSHMNDVFRAILDTTPLRYRRSAN